MSQSALGLVHDDISLRDRVAKLEAESLERVVWRVVEKDGVPEAVARQLRLEFLRFMALNFVTDKTLSPSPEVDAFWHAFILHTKDYIDFCQRHFGHYIHHEPQDHTKPAGPRDPEPGRRTNELISSMFPTRDPELWAKLAICSNSHCDRGACKRA